MSTQPSERPSRPGRLTAFVRRIFDSLPGSTNEVLKRYQFGLAGYQFATIAFGWFVLFLRSYVTNDWKGLPLLLLWSLAAAASASFVGLLFGIPKSVQIRGPLADEVVSDRGEKRTQAYAVNTNLEDISDWLTKIIVGVSLVEFRTLLTAFRDTADVLAKGLGDQAVDTAFAQGVILYFAAAGLFGGYILTRVALFDPFRVADPASAGVDRLPQNPGQRSTSGIAGDRKTG